MATTRIMPLHVGKGRTESRAISDIIDYVANPQKTDNGKLITGYACDSRTADAEFLLAKRQYIAATGRVRGADDVIAYHVRQSFRPGEITPEEANRLGVEFAKRFTNEQQVETVVLLSKGEVDSKKIRVEFSMEDMDMSEFQDGATYPQVKDYVLEHSGLKVSNLYISQIKRKCGIGVGKNYNLPKSEDSRQPQCPPEKEKAIREAFKYLGMI